MSTNFLPGIMPERYIENLETRGLSPGWAKKKPQMWPHPQSAFVPAVWRYAEARKALDDACSFVSPEHAERRNLIMVNPVPGNIYPSSQTLVAAYQLVLPGETARSHRHTPNALRLILDAGPDTFTIVDGVAVEMLPGDIVLTPSWQWHGHHNGGSEPAFWIDFLDVPLVQHVEGMFFENHPDGIEPTGSTDPDSSLRTRGTELAEKTRGGRAVEVFPGGLKTIGIHAIGLRRGQELAEPRRIDNSLYAVLSGSVDMYIEGLGSVSLSRGDVCVVPCWREFFARGGADASQLVRVTDAPAMAALGMRDVTRPLS